MDRLARSTVYCVPVDNGVQRRMHEIKDFAVRAWVPVALGLRNRLEWSDS